MQQYTTGRDAQGNWYVYNKSMTPYQSGMMYYGNDVNQFDKLKNKLNSEGRNEVWEGDYLQSGGGDDTTSRSSSGSSSGSGSGSSASSFDPNFYYRLIDALGVAQNNAKNATESSYSNSLNTLAGQRDRAYANLDNEQSKLDTQKSKSLSSLGGDLEKLMQSADIQMGMYGAGNSSAARASRFGISDLANKESGNISDEYNEQTGDIALNRKNYGDEYNEKAKSLQDELNSKLSSIDSDYNSQVNSLYQTIHDKSGNTAQAQEAANRIINSYQNPTKPNVSLDLPSYSGKGVSNSNLSGTVQVNAPTAVASQNFASSKKKKEEEY